MPWLQNAAVIRLMTLALLAATVLMARGNWELYAALLFSLAYSHYLLSFFYSRYQWQHIRASGGTWRTVLLAAGGLALYVAGLPLLMLFGVHHALNEVYTLYRKIPQRAGRGVVVSALFAANLLIYLTVLRHYPTQTALIGVLDGKMMVGAIAILYAVFFYALHSITREGERGLVREAVLAEAPWAAILALGFVYPMDFYDVIFYHFFFWLVFPFSTPLGRDSRASLRYAGLTILFSGIFLLLSPLGPLNYQLGGSLFLSQFQFWGYLHITLSFAMSRSNPDFIVRAFRPNAEPVTT
ncbi:MAG: hypothetical protein LJE84_10475 [Gammaproteobacteria bacterium]|nr:hypothetical protein [Gammaproteobacteria bacterium]